MRLALAATWISFAILVWHATPSHHWLDSGEIGAAAMELGVLHPPGAAGFGPLVRLGAVIPVGTSGFRAAVICCLFGAAAIGLLAAGLKRRQLPPSLIAVACAWVLAGLTFVRHGRSIEIYTFGLLLCALVLWGLDPVARHRRSAGPLLATFCATWAGLVFGDLRLALPPLVAVAWWRDLRRGRNWARWAPLMVALGGVVALALPLASARAPISDWGDPDGLGRWWDHLRASSILRAYGDEILPASPSLWWLNANAVVRQLAGDIGPLGPGLALLGGAMLLRADRAVGSALGWIAGVELFYAVGINPMGVRDRQTGLVLAFVCVVIGIVAVHLWTRGRRLRWMVTPAAATGLVLPVALATAGDGVATRSWAPHAWTRRALAHLPPGSVLLTQSDDLAAGVTAASVLEGARPDVVSIPAQHLYRPTPDRADPRAARIWYAAHLGTDELDRIRRAVAAIPPGESLALEMPRTGLFRRVDRWPPGGGLPLGLGAASGGPPANPVAEAQRAVQRWSDLARSPDDRRRLARALDAVSRGLLEAEGPGALPEALAVMEIAHAVSADSAARWVALGALYDRAGRSDLAVAHTRRALELEPGRPAALQNLALYLSRDPATVDEALELAERAAALRPWRVGGWVRLAQVREAAGDPEGAQKARDRARGRGAPP